MNRGRRLEDVSQDMVDSKSFDKFWSIDLPEYSCDDQEHRAQSDSQSSFTFCSYESDHMSLQTEAPHGNNVLGRYCRPSRMKPNLI